MSLTSPRIEADLLNTPDAVRRYMCVSVWWHLPYVERISKTEGYDMPILVKPQECNGCGPFCKVGIGGTCSRLRYPRHQPDRKNRPRSMRNVTSIPQARDEQERKATSILTTTRMGRLATGSHPTHRCDRVKSGVRHHERCRRGCWACPS